VTSRPLPAGAFITGDDCVRLARLLGPLLRQHGPSPALDEARPALSAIAQAAETERAAAAVRLAPAPSGWVSTDEAAAVRGCTRRAIVKAIAAGRLPARRQGRRWRVDAAALAD
jgi:excisionase family DNA binding protein